MNSITKLRSEIAELKIANNRQAETITWQSRKNSELARVNRVLTRKLENAERDIQLLQRAINRKTAECLAAQAAARPLLTDREDDEGTARMASHEVRGVVS